MWGGVSYLMSAFKTVMLSWEDTNSAITGVLKYTNLESVSHNWRWKAFKASGMAETRFLFAQDRLQASNAKNYINFNVLNRLKAIFYI